MFTDKDLHQIKTKGIELKVLENQLKNFEKWFPYADIEEPATPGIGIHQLSENEISELVNYYRINSNNYTIIKFVPASGAASRMFKTLFNFLESAEEDFSDRSFNSVYTFFHRLKEFAFYDDLKNKLAENGIDINEKLNNKDYKVIVDYLLNSKGLGYGELPKGLLKFHQYDSTSRVPLEEHLVEAALYAVSNGMARVHFTVSPEHMDNFMDTVQTVQKIYEDLFKIKFDISFSVQKSSTDTIAVDMDNNPFRNLDNSLLFRPAGHGALIENLNDLEGDIIFIKNIDNIVPDRLKPDTTLYKKAIGGLIMKLQSKIFEFLHELENNTTNIDFLNEVVEYSREHLNLKVPAGFNKLGFQERKDLIFTFLNRPIRICGMVMNEGEPGGGPFWVKNSKGEVSLQIVESSQVDMENAQQKNILQSSTHFNPVDLVCAIKNYKGEAFDLHKYIDPETGFISVKSKDGKNLKAQELPGLWNGAMADWNTIFVEVPIITFNPVKTVNDLLRPQHQPG